MKRSQLFLATLVMLAGHVQAADALVAVAANFSRTAQVLAEDFALRSGHRIVIATGSTGSLYAQIRAGAPYDILLAADRARPALLDESGAAVSGTRITYARGRLVLWSADPALIKADLTATLLQAGIVTIAIANPELAPYGVAGRETMQALRVWSTIRDRIVMGENVGQAHVLVSTQNAQLGFTALSLLSGDGKETEPAYLLVPGELYEPINQDAVLLRHGRDNPAAMEFLQYLQSEQGKSLIRSSGYGVD